MQQHLCWGLRFQLHSPPMASRARGTPRDGNSGTAASRTAQPGTDSRDMSESRPKHVEGEQTHTSLAEDIAKAISLCSRLSEELITLQLNPRKPIPADRWPVERRLSQGTWVTGPNWDRYKRHLLSVAEENTRRAREARLWWDWWEKSLARPSKAGPEPLTSAGIREALRIAAARREAEHQQRPRNSAKRTPEPVGTKVRGRNRPSREAIDAIALDLLQTALESAREEGIAFLPNREAIASAVCKQIGSDIHVSTLFGKTDSAEERVYRHPRFMKLWNQVQRHSANASEKKRGKGKPKRRNPKADGGNTGA